MKNSVFLFLLLMPSFLLAQKTKLIKDNVTNEIYYVLKTDKLIKQGEYQKYGFHRLLFKGYYKNGIRDSIWEFYNSNGDIIQKFNYSKNELLTYVLTDSEKEKRYKLLNGIDNPSIIPDRPPIFLGGEDYFNLEIIENIEFPEEAAKNGISGKVYVSFIIDKYGKAGSFNVLKSLGYGCDEEAIRVLKLIGDNWVPAIYNGQPVDVEYMYPLTFNIVIGR